MPWLKAMAGVVRPVCVSITPRRLPPALPLVIQGGEHFSYLCLDVFAQVNCRSQRGIFHSPRLILTFHPRDPLFHQIDRFPVHDRSRERRHMSTVAVRYSMEEDGSLRTPGRDQSGVGDAVGVVQRSDIEEPRLLQRSREFQLHLRVAAAGLDVALRAVGVQVGAGPAI